MIVILASLSKPMDLIHQPRYCRFEFGMVELHSAGMVLQVGEKGFAVNEIHNGSISRSAMRVDSEQRRQPCAERDRFMRKRLDRTHSSTSRRRSLSSCPSSSG